MLIYSLFFTLILCYLFLCSLLFKIRVVSLVFVALFHIVYSLFSLVMISLLYSVFVVLYLLLVLYSSLYFFIP
jgi:hypothetical protein